MGVTPEQLASFYPRLFHMAEPGSWEGICRHGLLSTSALLDLFEIHGETREEIELRRREKSIEITHPVHGRAVIRDQKPIIEQKLAASLTDCSPQDWYRILNGYVFFWLSPQRLMTLLSAREYRGRPHVVVTLDTLRVATQLRDSIVLSPMNSGNTLPIAHPRGTTTFRKMQDYPFQERLKRGPYYTIVELAVKVGIPRILDFAVSAEVMTSDGSKTKTLSPLYASDTAAASSAGSR